MSLRRVVTVWGILGLLLAIQGRANAALLVAPEQIPSDALVVISVSDAPGMWDNVKKSPLYGSVKNLLELPAVKNDPGFQGFFSDIQAAEKRIGIPLDLESLFTKVLVGADFALSIRSEATEEPDILMILKFKDPKVAGLILKEMEADANKGPATPTPASPAAPQASPALPKATHQTIAGAAGPRHSRRRAVGLPEERSPAPGVGRGHDEQIAHHERGHRDRQVALHPRGAHRTRQPRAIPDVLLS